MGSVPGVRLSQQHQKVSGEPLTVSPTNPQMVRRAGVSMAHAPSSRGGNDDYLVLNLEFAGVPEELRGIIRDKSVKASTGVLPGKLILDEAFTETSMEAALHQSYRVVHIASHFRFQPGNETQSFLLLGDGTHLTLADLKNMGQLFSGVDLLTLSACNTAVGERLGDGKEVESFGVIAQKKGASAVMASLWPVMDQSTQLFMREFYRLHSENPNVT